MCHMDMPEGQSSETLTELNVRIKLMRNYLRQVSTFPSSFIDKQLTGVQ